MRSLIVSAVLLFAMPALAQQQGPPDPAKLAPLYRQQRDISNDAIAACAVATGDLQAKIAELEKKLTEAQAAPK
jgi:hypothetical protein